MLLQFGGWFVLVAVFFWGNLRLKDLGLDFKNFLRGLTFTLATSIILVILGQVFKSPYQYINSFMLPGVTTDEANSLLTMFVYLLPATILQELLFRGFLFPQLFLKFRGPYRFFNSMVVSCTLAIFMQFEILFIIMAYFDNPQNILFSLFIISYTISMLYFKDRDIFWCIGLSFLIYPFLEVFRLELNVLLIAQLYQVIIYIIQRLKPKPTGTTFVMNERVDHDDSFLMQLFDRYSGTNLILLTWLTVLYVLDSYVNDMLDVDLSSIFFVVSVFLLPCLGIAFEIMGRLRAKPAL
jgi:hypothetical protein